jgi:hypothetical protein
MASAIASLPPKRETTGPIADNSEINALRPRLEASSMTLRQYGCHGGTGVVCVAPQVSVNGMS